MTLIPEMLEHRFMETPFLRIRYMHMSVLVVSCYLCTAQSASPGIFCIIGHMQKEYHGEMLFICGNLCVK